MNVQKGGASGNFIWLYMSGSPSNEKKENLLKNFYELLDTNLFHKELKMDFEIKEAIVKYKKVIEEFNFLDPIETDYDKNFLRNAYSNILSDSGIEIENLNSLLANYAIRIDINKILNINLLDVSLLSLGGDIEIVTDGLWSSVKKFSNIVKGDNDLNQYKIYNFDRKTLEYTTFKKLIIQFNSLIQNKQRYNEVDFNKQMVDITNQIALFIFQETENRYTHVLYGNISSIGSTTKIYYRNRIIYPKIEKVNLIDLFIDQLNILFTKPHLDEKTSNNEELHKILNENIEKCINHLKKISKENPFLFHVIAISGVVLSLISAILAISGLSKAHIILLILGFAIPTVMLSKEFYAYYRTYSTHNKNNINHKNYVLSQFNFIYTNLSKLKEHPLFYKSNKIKLKCAPTVNFITECELVEANNVLDEVINTEEQKDNQSQLPLKQQLRPPLLRRQETYRRGSEEVPLLSDGEYATKYIKYKKKYIDLKKRLL